MAKISMLKSQLGTLKATLAYAPEGERQTERYRNGQAWRQWYNTTKWRKLRWSILMRDELTCQMCGKIEGDTSKLVADHREAHRGDERLFWDANNLQTLCKSPCHDKHKQRLERR